MKSFARSAGSALNLVIPSKTLHWRISTLHDGNAAIQKHGHDRLRS
jgi:hypothetical protein